MEKTVIILKPDCMKKNLIGAVIDRFAQVGLRVIACKMIQLDKDILDIHYAHHKDKPFFGEVVEYMVSTPVMTGRSATARACTRPI